MIQQTIKNVTVTPENDIIYNFGKKRPVPNCEELVKDAVWHDILLNKWIYLRDEERKVNTFIKHIFDGRKLIQVIYSGEDIYCDGVYRLYKVKIVNLGKDGIFVDPQDFAVVYNSFAFPEGTRFIDQLVSDRYITEKEKAILLNPKASDAFAKTIYRMKANF